MGNEKVKNELSNVQAYFEFDFSYLEFANHLERALAPPLNENIMAQVCLFHLALIGSEEAAKMNNVTKEIHIWYNAFFKPLCFIENINYRLEPIANSKHYFFKATFKLEYIASHCDFR